MSDTEYPGRPDRSVKIYEIDGHWRESGVISHQDWNGYALGYLNALEGLIKMAKEHQFYYNTFGYPIFFLFSHYLEIRMKEIIINGRDLINETPYFPRTHNLNQLWVECKRILKIVENWDEYSQLDDESQQNFLTLDYFIREIAVDNVAQSYRYPVDRKGKPLLSDPRIKSLNVHNLAIVAEWMSFQFEGFSIEINENRKTKQEIAEENCHEGFL